ncbi:carboxypeptidase-like regulatory domain-containing protein, partial [candidate division KSB1 bacterium]
MFDIFKRTIILFLLLIIIIRVPGIYGGTTGKIVGIVTDKTTGEGLPGVNIVIEGTTLGAATDEKGNYFIINIPAGVYSIAVTMIGYKSVTAEKFNVIADFTSELNLGMEITAIEGEVVVIETKRPLIQKDQTATVKVITKEEIQNLPSRGYQRAVTLQSGVVMYGGGNISVRGGRLSETAYYVDGFSQQDPLTGRSTTAINSNAVEQVTVITGGFNAEYGKIMSGVVNVITKGGTKDYHGSFEM